MFHSSTTSVAPDNDIIKNASRERQQGQGPWRAPELHTISPTGLTVGRSSAGLAPILESDNDLDATASRHSQGADRYDISHPTQHH
jgi:hypothetical protein